MKAVEELSARRRRVPDQQHTRLGARQETRSRLVDLLRDTRGLVHHKKQVLGVEPLEPIGPSVARADREPVGRDLQPRPKQVPPIKPRESRCACAISRQSTSLKLGGRGRSSSRPANAERRRGTTARPSPRSPTSPARAGTGPHGGPRIVPDGFENLTLAGPGLEAEHLAGRTRPDLEG